jgi:hypothetical protein
MRGWYLCFKNATQVRDHLIYNLNSFIQDNKNVKLTKKTSAFNKSLNLRKMSPTVESACTIANSNFQKIHFTQ